MIRNKIRVAKYKRVSTDEQKLKKNSIIAQDELLDQYIENHPEMILVGDFSDEGVSGTKIMRTELQKLLEMVENDEVDLILVTKLDRWFRNVAFYYRVQEILERNKVAWKTILEDYDTMTADGRLKVNIMLSVAQNEAERTSERIKVVFDSKVRNGLAITGGQPFGFMIGRNSEGSKIVVHNPDQADILLDALDTFEALQSLRQMSILISQKYNIDFSLTNASTAISTTKLYGYYRGNPNYCEPYIGKERYDRIQEIRSNTLRDSLKDGRHYIFRGLLKCPRCGRTLASTTCVLKKGEHTYEYARYRCQKRWINKECDYSPTIGEKKAEKLILDQVLPQLEKLMIDMNIQDDTPKKTVNKKAIHAEMERLNNMFQKGRISEDDYDRRYEELENQLKQENTSPKKDYSKIKEQFSGDFKTLYNTFTPEEKSILWRSIIDYIEFDGDLPVIHFL